MSFVGILLYSCLLLINLINLRLYVKLKILGFMLNTIWAFCSIELKLMKLACCFDVIDHYNKFSTCVMINWSIYFEKLTSGLNFFWGFN